MASDPKDMPNNIRAFRRAKDMTIEQLAEAIGYSESHVQRMESGKRGVSLELALKIAGALGVRLAELEVEFDGSLPDEPGIVLPTRPSGRAEIQRVPIAVPTGEGLPEDIPILGTAAGSIVGDGIEGFEFLAGPPLGYTTRLPPLRNVPEAYAVLVWGESMIPEHKPGEVRIANPRKPVAQGDSVIVQTRRWEDDPGQGYIKTYRKRTVDRIFLEQHNPPSTIQIPAQYVVSIHHVMTQNELLGVQ